VLLLDEPLSALDAKIRVELRNEIRRIQRQLAITTIYVTHDQEEALSLSDRIVVMNAGRVEQIGAPFEIYNYPATAFTASFIGQLNLAPVRVADPTAGTCLLGGQVVQVTPPLEAPAGAAARLAIRPEELALRPLDEPRQPELNTLRGRVETVLFLGSIVRVRVAIEPADAAHDEAVTLAVDLFNERLLAIPQPAEEVLVVFAPHACWMVREP
jgi:putative spermidine/putrescine transport system ATP-binding protein